MKIEELNRGIDYLIGTSGLLVDDEVIRGHIRVFFKFIITQDEHDSDNPFKVIPMYEHTKYLIDKFISEQLIIVAKSRQLMATWIYCGLILWDAMFMRGRLNIIINKREDDANETIDRIRFIYGNLPERLRAAFPVDKTPQGELGSYCRLAFINTNSIIRGLPQNPDAVRKNTASILFIDEMAFIERAEACYTAALPTVRGGGKLILVSTPKGQNFFAKLFNDV